MADTSPLAGLLDRAGEVFSLAGKLGRAFHEEHQERRIDPAGWNHHAVEFDQFCAAVLELRNAMQNPPDGFAPLTKPLLEAARVAKSKRAAMQRPDGRAWAEYLEFFPDLNSICQDGWEAVKEVTKAGRLDDPFAFVDEPAYSLLDRFPATPAGHVAFLEFVRDEVHYAAEAKRQQLKREYSNATIQSMIGGIMWAEARQRVSMLTGLPADVVQQVGRMLQRELTVGTVGQVDELLTPAVNSLRDAWENRDNKLACNNSNDEVAKNSFQLPFVTDSSLTDDERIRLIAAVISDQRKAGGKWVNADGVTCWEQQNPQAIPWLAERGLTVEDALTELDSWGRRQRAIMENAERMGRGPLVQGFSPQMEVYRVRPDVSDVLTGRALLHCHAGCKVDAICVAIGLRMVDLMPTADALPMSSKHKGMPRIVAEYDYRDEAGNVLFQAVRYDPKGFRQRRLDGKSGWTWSVKGMRVVPYRLPELLAEQARPVAVAEGEKDCDNLARIGVLATCNACGAGKWTAEHSWPEIVSFDVLDLPDFPTHVLPNVLREWVEAESHATQTPADLPALLALAVCSAMIARRVEVEPRPGWREPVNLFVAVLMEPGNRKSAVFADAMKPLRDLDAELIEDARSIVARALSARRQD